MLTSLKILTVLSLNTNPGTILYQDIAVSSVRGHFQSRFCIKNLLNNVSHSHTARTSKQKQSLARTRNVTLKWCCIVATQPVDDPRTTFKFKWQPKNATVFDGWIFKKIYVCLSVVAPSKFTFLVMSWCQNVARTVSIRIIHKTQIAKISYASLRRKTAVQ